MRSICVVIILSLGLALAADLLTLDAGGTVRLRILDTGATEITADDATSPGLRVAQSNTGKALVVLDGAAEVLTVADGGNVGVNAPSPGARLEVGGQVKITGGAPGVGRVLTSDAAGLATWQSPSASSTLVFAKAIDRSTSGSTASTAWTQVATFDPLTAGNHLTMNNLKLEGRSNGTSPTVRLRYTVEFADGTSVLSGEYSTPSTNYVTLEDTPWPVPAGFRGSVTRIVLEARHSGGTGSSTGRLTIVGFETPPAGLLAAKPLSRRFTGSTGSTTYVTIITWSPLTAGNHLTPLSLKLEASETVLSGSARTRYTINYADGSSWASGEFNVNGSTVVTLAEPSWPAPGGMRGTITSVVVESRATNSNPGSSSAILTVKGFETPP